MSREIKFRAWDGYNRKMYQAGPENEGVRQFFWAQDDHDMLSKPMQYTGLHDKSGVEIYEGDLVVFAYDNGTRSDVPYQVMFENAAYWMQTADCHHGDWVWGNHERLLVIGNIYENPELLDA